VLATELLHLPDKPAGVEKSRRQAPHLATELLHLPDKPARVDECENQELETALAQRILECKPAAPPHCKRLRRYATVFRGGVAIIINHPLEGWDSHLVP